MELPEQVLGFIEAGHPVALAVILDTEGSAPRKAGTYALVEPTGRILGTIGGGALEAQVQERAREACAAGKPCLLRCDLDGGAPAQDTPLCGGSVRVLIDPEVVRHRAVFAAARRALERREGGHLAICVSAGDPPDVHLDWLPWHGSGDPDELSREATLLLPVFPRPSAVVIGGGHVGQAVAAQAHFAGFDITVLEDRREYADERRFPPGTTFRCGPVEETLTALPKTPDTYIVIVTRGHRHDMDALKACIHSRAGYIGMIGSRRKVALVRGSFLETGTATQSELDRVHAPIGLDIGAETVPEIATSIVAEMISVRRKGGTPPERSPR